MAYSIIPGWLGYAKNDTLKPKEGAMPTFIYGNVYRKSLHHITIYGKRSIGLSEYTYNEIMKKYKQDYYYAGFTYTIDHHTGHRSIGIIITEKQLPELATSYIPSNGLIQAENFLKLIGYNQDQDNNELCYSLSNLSDIVIKGCKYPEYVFDISKAIKPEELVTQSLINASEFFKKY